IGGSNPFIIIVTPHILIFFEWCAAHGEKTSRVLSKATRSRAANAGGSNAHLALGTANRNIRPRTPRGGAGSPWRRCVGRLHSRGTERQALSRNSRSLRDVALAVLSRVELPIQIRSRCRGVGLVFRRPVKKAWSAT